MAQVAQGTQLQPQGGLMVEIKDYDRVGRYAVEEANKRHGWHLVFKRVVQGSETTWKDVKLYSLVIECTNCKLYDALVWETKTAKGLISFVPLLKPPPVGQA